MIYVDGSFFKAAREKVRSENTDVGVNKRPRIGTQEWLAHKAGVSRRSIQKLEQSGHVEASPETVKRVSRALGIEKFEEHIIDTDCVRCRANNHIDFRPGENPKKNPKFAESVMVMTIDPLLITTIPDNKNLLLLKTVKAKLTGLGDNMPFIWFAQVSLTDDAQGKGWLGIVKHLNELYIEANNDTLNIPMMFTQDNGSRVRWCDFVTMVEDSEKSQFDIEIKLEFALVNKRINEFARFSQMINIHVPIQLLKILFQQGRDKYQSEWPRRAQLRTIV